MSILIKPAYDADASAYFTTAGVTNTAGRQQISRFVTGIKDLGLYNNMVCWPLRSSQNAGTGTTAYSLGGLGTFNGTLVNSPTWGADGIVFSSASSQRITTSYRQPAGQLWTFSDILASSIASNISVITKDNQTTNRDWAVFYSTGTVRFRLDANIGSGIGVRISLPSSNTTTRQVLQFSHDGNDYYGKRNLEARQTASGIGTITDSAQTVVIGGFPSSSFFSGTIGSCILFTTAPSSDQEDSLYTLYKTTLGQGLGLP